MRPFFSIIIPCHNTKPELINDVLQSIYNNTSKYDDLEIIVSDDDSDNKEYLEEVKKFKSETGINTKIVYFPKFDDKGLEIRHGAGNTRERGVREATGEWITFIDHDDIYINDAFDTVRKIIKEYNEKYIIKSDIQTYNTVTKEYDESLISGYANVWLHGKFYNMDNLWKKYDLHFKRDLTYYEDMYINNTLNCIFYKINKTEKIERVVATLYPIYIWRKFPTSLSNSESKMGTDNTIYNYNHYNHFLEASYEIYVEQFEKLDNPDEEDIDFYKTAHVNCLLYGYFFLQAFNFAGYDCTNHRYTINKMKREIFNRFNMDADSIFEFVDKLDVFDKPGEYFNSTRKDIIRTSNDFIEYESFYDFLSK